MFSEVVGHHLAVVGQRIIERLSVLVIVCIYIHLWASAHFARQV